MAVPLTRAMTGSSAAAAPDLFLPFDLRLLGHDRKRDETQDESGYYCTRQHGHPSEGALGRAAGAIKHIARAGTSGEGSLRASKGT
jgi:hypothetical protein